MTKKADLNHHEGKRTGYELINGEYHIAPLYLDQFQELVHKVEGIQQLLAIVTAHATEDLGEISKAEERIWDNISEDLGIVFTDGNWVYSNGVIKKIEKKTE